MEKNIKIVLGVAIGIFLLVGSLLLFTDIGKLSIYGSSTLSVSNVNLQSSNPYLSGKVWLLNFVAGDLAQSYFGSFDSSEIVDGSNKATNGFTIDVEYEDQICNYDITQTSRTPIYDDIKMVTWSCFSNTLTKAKENFGSGTVLYYGFDSFKLKNCWAVGSPTKSPVGYLSSPDLESEFTVTIDAGDDRASKTFNTLAGSTQGMVGDFAFVDWVGNLVSGKSCPDKDPYLPIYVNGYWRVGDEDAYDDYTAQISTLNTRDRMVRENAISNLRNLVTLAKSSQSFGSLNSRTSLSSASVDVTILDPIQFPVTSLYIKAESLGIYTPSPDFRLFSPNSDCFKTGDQGSVEVSVKNTGDERGSVTLFAQCENPFSSSRNILVSLQPGESATRLIPITASASQKELGSCTIFAESVSGTKSVKVDVCVDPQQTCNPDENFCSVSGDREVIKECSSDGATSKVVKTCQVGEVCKDLKCVQGSDPSGNWFSRFFKGIGNFFSNMFSGALSIFKWIKFILIAISTIASLFISYNFLEFNKFLEENKAVRWIISGIISILIALFLIVFIGSIWFWIILIGYGLYLFFSKPIRDFLGRFR